ncbi:putative Dol-P-Glc:Glc(2)Man(9)GlcNAc(2)-PP-Dol alpha-1,2-glucosyltransferase [Nymphon striatum]|nr:putative Dol-P-Glc:Glc(2)Man(9)GlcNAc(2)-PP-Dol alpha-1,2-glucosyltransferase [Nymphon striatum]
MGTRVKLNLISHQVKFYNDDQQVPRSISEGGWIKFRGSMLFSWSTLRGRLQDRKSQKSVHFGTRGENKECGIGMETSIEILEQQTGQQVGQTPKSLFKFVYSLLTRFKKPYLFMCFFLNLIINLICSVFFYFITGILFLVFLYKNEGIVVGDKSAHEACINFPQLGYFLSFMLVSCLPQMISVDLIKQFFISIWNNVIITTLLTVAACLLIKEFTYVHPYTLADNRHLTFYVWKWIYERHDLIRFLDLVLWEPTKGNRRGKKTINFIDNLKSTHLEEIEEIVTVMKSRDVWKELVKLGGVRARPK